jgi:hypothetical protein
MSAFFEANKDDYYKKLMNARLKNDYNGKEPPEYV